MYYAQNNLQANINNVMWVNTLGRYRNNSAVLAVTWQLTLQFFSLRYGIQHINKQYIRRCRHHNIHHRVCLSIPFL